MTTIKAFIKKHPVLTYFTLTFAISWGGILLVIGGPAAIPSTAQQSDRLFPIALMVMLVGPSAAGILLTGLLYRKDGLHAFLSRLLKWRVGARWYGVALLTTPLLVMATLFMLSLLSPIFLPDIATTNDKVSLLLTGIAVGLMGGILEELGWTGFAIPELRRRYGILSTGLIVGILWGVWHFLVTFWGSGDSSGALSLDLLLPPLLFYVGVLPVYRVLMVWVYDRTGSLLVAMLMHASLTASTVFILSPEARGVPLLIYYIILTAVLWGIITAIAMANRMQLSRQPLRKQVA
ncbi:hypothetical protein ANRL4_02969 [Anaerolineae bacterium]|nr:hypothetical protein ANRL4_02969 [Anaerolineae bacterium]